MKIFDREGAAEVPVELRIQAAEALGQGGDPRLKAEERDERLLPVPGTGIRLGKYPVTVEEYRRFVEDRGYEDPKWWSPDGWKLREEKGWTEPGGWPEQLSTPNRPVVLVGFRVSCALSGS